MKIMLVTETLVTGGAETFVVRLANAVARAHDVSIVVLEGDLIDETLLAQLDRRVTAHSFDPPGRWPLRMADGALRRCGIDFSPRYALAKAWFRALLRREQPDVIHSHLLKSDRLVADVRADVRPRPRHVLTVHGDYAPFLNREEESFLLNLDEKAERIVSSVDAIVGVSQDHLSFFELRYPQARGGKLHLIYNGYEPPEGDFGSVGRAELGLPCDHFLFGMVARGIERKGWQKAVDAFASLAIHDASLVLVGDGPYLDRLRAASLPRNVILTGFSPCPLEFIRHFDVGLLPSLLPHESLPTVIIEYLYLAKPVIATTVGEIPRMLEAGDGRLAGHLLSFQTHDVSVSELAGAMHAFHSDPVLYDTCSRAARVAFRKFGMDRCVARYEAVYAGRAASDAA